ncbi:MAG: rRNA maturation RNase YbeY [Rhodobacteraceae bacterium]|nr:rRNA maturation RNase YbeY [Paracoccaceae bacterium]MCY4138383.1 rRNA maturation RNase YbeY [Paracoccaceae bacterium]
MDIPTPVEPVDVLVEDRRWKAIDLRKLATRALLAVRSELGLGASTPGFVVMASDDARLAELNGVFRNRPIATNILTWPATDACPQVGGGPASRHSAPPNGTGDEDWHWSGSLGDVALAFETCESEAAMQGKSLDDHVTHLLIHGVLHLLGYRHDTDSEAGAMQAIEISALAKLGISNPY